jgi:hypothetical protein
LLNGEPLSGTWYDRTTEHEKRRAHQDYDPADFATKYEVNLSPLPFLMDKSPEEQRAWYRQLVEDIEIETRKNLKRERKKALGADKVLRQPPHKRPNRIKRSPAPLCHCATREKWIEFKTSYKTFVAMFREASRRLRRGDRNAEFPPNCFPPRLSFNVVSYAPT